LLLVLSTDGSAELRHQINTAAGTQLLFGLDVNRMKPGDSVTFDDAAYDEKTAPVGPDLKSWRY